MDPDNLAWQEKDNLAKWLQQRSVDFVAYFYAASKPNDKDPDSVAESLNNACILVAAVQDDIKRNEFIKSLCSLYKVEDQTQAITAKNQRYQRILICLQKNRRHEARRLWH